MQWPRGWDRECLDFGSKFVYVESGRWWLAEPQDVPHYFLGSQGPHCHLNHLCYPELDSKDANEELLLMVLM